MSPALGCLAELTVKCLVHPPYCSRPGHCFIFRLLRSGSSTSGGTLHIPHRRLLFLKSEKPRVCLGKAEGQHKEIMKSACDLGPGTSPGQAAAPSSVQGTAVLYLTCRAVGGAMQNACGTVSTVQYLACGKLLRHLSFFAMFSQCWGQSVAWRERQKQDHLGVTRSLHSGSLKAPFFKISFYYCLLCFCEEHRPGTLRALWNQPHCSWSLAGTHILSMTRHPVSC